MKKIITAALALTLCTGLCGCGSKKDDEKFVFQAAVDNVTDDFVEWYVSDSDSNTEEGARKFLDEKVKIDEEKKTLSFSCYSGVQSSDSEALKDFYGGMFNIEVKWEMKLAEFINKELDIPDSVTEDIWNTPDDGNRQGYDGDKYQIVWSLSKNEIFLILYREK